MSTAWEDVKHLPWKEIQAIPVENWRACYQDAWTNTSHKTRDIDFMGTGVPAIVRFDLQDANKKCKTLVQVQPFGQLHYTCVLEDKTERPKWIASGVLNREAQNSQCVQPNQSLRGGAKSN